MSMSLTDKDVKKIYKLSRINAGDGDVEQSTNQLNGIFGFIESLQEVNTEGVEPIAGVGGFTLRMASDEVGYDNMQDKVLANAPEAKFGCYLVPKVVDES